MSRQLQFWVVTLFLCLAPAVPRAAEDLHRVVVLPLSSLAVEPSAGEELRRQLTESLVQKFDVSAVDQQTTDQAVLSLCGEPDQWWDCLGQDENLFQIGRTLRAGWVIAGKLAAMGDTRVLKFRTADLASSTVSSEIINIRGGDPKTYLARFLLLHQNRLPHKPSPEPWYQKWYVWTAAGVLVAAAVAGGLVWGLASGPENQWDLRRTLP